MSGIVKNLAAFGGKFSGESRSAIASDVKASGSVINSIDLVHLRMMIQVGLYAPLATNQVLLSILSDLVLLWVDIQAGL